MKKMSWQSVGVLALGIPVFVFLIFFVLNTSPVLIFGPPGSVKIVPPSVGSDADAEICFDEITWLRFCPSAFNYYIINESDGKRTDYEPHAINRSSSTKIGVPIKKCRAWHVPKAESGKKTMFAWSTSRCPWGAMEIRTDIPPVKFIIQ